MNGWIRLDRAIQDNFLWQEPEALKLWLYLLMAASLTDKATAFNGQMLTIKRGQLVFGLNAADAGLALELGHWPPLGVLSTVALANFSLGATRSL